MDLACRREFVDPFTRSNWEIKRYGVMVGDYVFAEPKMQDKYLYTLLDIATSSYLYSLI